MADSAMKSKGLEVPPHPAPAPASVASRAWAGIIDLFILGLVLLFAGVPAAMLLDMFLEASVGVRMAVDVALPLVGVAIAWLYSAGGESSRARATPGKRARHLVVTDENGTRITFARASLRFVGKLAIVATGGLGLLAAKFEGRRRALDDLIAGTRVGRVEVAPVGSPSGGRLAAILAVLAVSVALVVKLASDAHRDYEERARLEEILADARAGVQVTYANYYRASGRVPSRTDLPLSHPLVQSLDVDREGAIVLRLHRPRDAVLRLSPAFGKDGSVTWSCHAQAERKSAIPPSCRP